MTIDERLRAAHRRQLDAATTTYREAGSPGFDAPGNHDRAKVVGIAAVVLLLIVGGASLAGYVARNTEPAVRVDIAPSPPVASEGGATGAGDPAAVSSDEADTTIDVVPVPTPTLTPTAGPTSTATPRTVIVSEPPKATDDDPLPESTPTAGDQLSVLPTPTMPPVTTTPEPGRSTQGSGMPPPAVTPTITATEEPAIAVVATTTPTAIPTQTPAPTETPTSTTTPVPVPTSAPMPTATPALESTPTPEPTATPTPVYAAGVASTVCPSGLRAQLELASLRYVGSSTGWNRLADLTNEQDGPYYFLAWEPNYPNPVTVEVTLAEPIQASEFRVFQDPFTPVSGSINFATAGETFSIELSGVDGWRVHSFVSPVVVESFTIHRTDPAANIMEVLVCRAR